MSFVLWTTTCYSNTWCNGNFLPHWNWRFIVPLHHRKILIKLLLWYLIANKLWNVSDRLSLILLNFKAYRILLLRSSDLFQSVSLSSLRILILGIIKWRWLFFINLFLKLNGDVKRTLIVKTLHYWTAIWLFGFQLFGCLNLYSRSLWDH